MSLLFFSGSSELTEGISDSDGSVVSDVWTTVVDVDAAVVGFSVIFEHAVENSAAQSTSNAAGFRIFFT